MKTLYILAIGLLFGSKLFAQCSVTTLIGHDCMRNCTGTAQVNTTTGSAPFTFAWSNGDMGSAAGLLCADSTYVLTMTDALGCIAYDTIVMIPGFQAISHPIISTSCPTCCDGIDTLNMSWATSCGPLMYQWFGPGGDPSPTPLNYRSTLCAASYTIQITDQCGCSGIWTSSIPTGNPTGITQQNENSPSITREGNQLHISSGVNVELIQVLDMYGRLIYVKEDNGNDFRLEINNFPASTIIVLVTADGNRTGKVIIRE